MRRLFGLALALALGGCDDGGGGGGADDPGFDPTGDFQPIGLPPPDAAPRADAARPPRDAAPPDPDDGVPPPDAAVEPPPAPLSLRFVPLEQDSGALRITDLAFLPGGDELLVTDKDGEVVHLRMEGERMVRLGGFTLDDTWFDSDAGLIAVAVDPRFAHNRFIYLGVSTTQQSNEIRRYTFDPDDYAATLTSEVLVIEVTGERAPRSWHNVGSMGFTREGHLWALFGDKVLDQTAQDLDSPLGAVLRISPDHDDDGGFDVPADNPYADGSGHPAVWAKGLRSPWKGFYDPADGHIWFGDVGLDTFEEVNRVSAPGQNFGWPDIEGPCDDACGDTQAPWLAYGRGNSHPFVQDDARATTSRLRSVWVGGRPVRAAADPDPYAGRWDDVIVFGDAFSGFVRATSVDGGGESYPVGHLHFATAMTQGPGGYMYAAALGTWPVDAPTTPSPIYRVELAD